MPNRSNSNPFDADEKCILSINEGDIYINASGDGIDSNGWVYINGGNTIVDGPTNNGNGALDAGMGIIMNKGNLIAIGSSEMASSLNQTSSIFSLSIYLDETLPKDTSIEIEDQNYNTILSHTSAKSFSHIVAASNSFSLGNVYRLYLDDKLYTNITVSNIVTTIGDTTRNMPPNENKR